MSKIALLPDILIDQIAAGEVLENPASAVKELVENAIDAGALEIRVSIEGGGLQRIEVEDNGCGMDRDDLAICLLRHATSKVRSLEDLFKIATKGFRGEALAAISAVSKLEIRSSSGKEAFRLFEGKVEPCARRKGTTVELRGLFQHTPARLKFQKSASQCAAAILKTVETISLAHPEVRFELQSNGKNVLKLLPTDWKQRILEVVGPLDIVLKGVKGLIGRPEDAKMGRSSQYLFVNGRPVVSGLIAKAVKEGFGTRLQEKTFPAFVIFLEVAPEKIDINVHPQKKEVRFLEEGAVYSMVRRAVSSAFEQEMGEIAPMPWDFTAPTLPPYFFQAEEMFAAPGALTLPIEMPWRIVGLMDDFLLIDRGGWHLVDLRGALARVLFEQIEKKSMVAEPLLIPFHLDVDDPEGAAEMLLSMGIEARAVAKKKLGIFSMPFGMEIGDVEQLTVERQEREIAAALTKSIRSSKRIFSLDEATLIWQRLQNCTDPCYDPLGKKVSVRLTKEDFRRFF